MYMHQVCTSFMTSQSLLKGAELAWWFTTSHTQLLCWYKLELINVPMHQSIVNHLSNTKETIISSIFDRVVPVTCQTALVQTYSHLFGCTSEPFVCEPQSIADIRPFKPAVIA